jgi:hypothetical protein
MGDFSSSAQLALAVVLAIATAIATYVNLKLKGDVQAMKLDVERANSALESRISEKLDRFRSEFSSSFVPEKLAASQWTNVFERLEKHDKEIQANRDRYHDVSQEFIEKVLANFMKFTADLLEAGRDVKDLERRIIKLEGK